MTPRVGESPGPWDGPMGPVGWLAELRGMARWAQWDRSRSSGEVPAVRARDSGLLDRPESASAAEAP